MFRLALIVMATAVAACTNELPQSDENFTDLAKQDAKSDAFSAKLRLLGSIHPGETLSSLAYTHKPPFRGLVLLANHNDAIRLDVRSNDGGDAVAWLLDSGFNTLSKNDDASSSTPDASIDLVVPASVDPIHYIVWKDVADQDATFAVSFANDSHAPTCSVAVSPAGGPVNAIYSFTMTAENALACTLDLDARGAEPVPCVFSTNNVEGTFWGPGDHTYAMTAQGAEGVAQCSTSFTLTP